MRKTPRMEMEKRKTFGTRPLRRMFFDLFGI